MILTRYQPVVVVDDDPHYRMKAVQRSTSDEQPTILLPLLWTAG